jgi:futalosine hydrolase
VGRLLDGLLCDDGDRALLVVAAPAEARAVLGGFGRDEGLAERFWERHELRGGVDCVVTGVGKANAAGALMRVLDVGRDRVVISCGVAGSLPESGCEIGAVVVSTRSVYADEGIETEEGFLTCASMGFGFVHGGGDVDSMGVDVDEEVLGVLGELADVRGVVATVSTCSGTDALAEGVVQRTGAIAEAMEGAAVGVCVANASLVEGAGARVRFGELRVVSNTTGDRSWQKWDLASAMEGLGEVAASL